jgi:hypothetical protein
MRQRIGEIRKCHQVIIISILYCHEKNILILHLWHFDSVDSVNLVVCSDFEGQLTEKGDFSAPLPFAVAGF